MYSGVPMTVPEPVRGCVGVDTVAVGGLGGEAVGRDRDGHEPVEGRVVGPEDGRHATAADPFHDAIGAEGRPLLDVHGRSPAITRTPMTGGRATRPKVEARSAIVRKTACLDPRTSIRSATSPTRLAATAI